MTDLHSVAATKTRGLRPVRPIEPFKLLALAARAIDFTEQARDLNSPRRVVPDIDVNEFSVDRFALPGEDLERFRRLNAGDNVDDGGEDAGGFAGAGLARIRRRLKDAAQARRLAGQNRQRLAIRADAAAI